MRNELSEKVKEVCATIAAGLNSISKVKILFFICLDIDFNLPDGSEDQLSNGCTIIPGLDE